MCSIDQWKIRFVLLINGVVILWCHFKAIQVWRLLKIFMARKVAENTCDACFYISDLFSYDNCLRFFFRILIQTLEHFDASVINVRNISSYPEGESRPNSCKQSVNNP